MPEVKLTDLAKAVPAAPGAGGDFLSQVNSTLANLQKTFQMAQTLRGLNQAQAPGPEKAAPRQPPTVIMSPPAPAPAPAPRGFDLEKVLDTLINMGNGDKTVGEMLEMLSPVTLKQAREVIRNGKSAE